MIDPAEPSDAPSVSMVSSVEMAVLAGIVMVSVPGGGVAVVVRIAVALAAAPAPEPGMTIFLSATYAGVEQVVTKDMVCGSFARS